MFTDTDRLCDSGFTPETLSGSDFICVHLSTSVAKNGLRNEVFMYKVAVV